MKIYMCNYVPNFKFLAYFVFLKEKVPNISTSEKLESLRYKIMLFIFQILFLRINLSLEKRGQ